MQILPQTQLIVAVNLIASVHPLYTSFHVYERDYKVGTGVSQSVSVSHDPKELGGGLSRAGALGTAQAPLQTPDSNRSPMIYPTTTNQIQSRH